MEQSGQEKFRAGLLGEGQLLAVDERGLRRTIESLKRAAQQPWQQLLVGQGDRVNVPRAQWDPVEEGGLVQPEAGMESPMAASGGGLELGEVHPLFFSVGHVQKQLSVLVDSTRLRRPGA